MSRLAIVSTYNENCGNASYTHVLKNAFSEFLEVDVLGLDLFLLQKKGSTFRIAADEHIKKLARQLAEYDYVNIQFEAGLFGTTIPDIRRRIGWLIKAAPNLILTMHRIDVGTMSFGRAVSDSLRLRSAKPMRQFRGGRNFSGLYYDIIMKVRKAAKHKNAWIKVHTKRERRVVTDIYDFANCFDYPLAFLTSDERDYAWAHHDRLDFLRRYNFKSDDMVVGLFGYISEYKGIETAIRALGELPERYKLAIFGSHHPQSFRAHTQFHPYLESLVSLMDDVDDENYGSASREAKLKRLGEPQFKLERGAPKPLSKEMLPSLRDRVRFIGSLPDPEFIEALRLTDAVVLPYIEVGQSMSGVVVLGMEAGSKIVAANNHSFAETKKYFGDSFWGFDMGNYVELAQKILACASHPHQAECREARDKAFEKYNIRDSIKLQLSKFGFQTAEYQ